MRFSSDRHQTLRSRRYSGCWIIWIAMENTPKDSSSQGYRPDIPGISGTRREGTIRMALPWPNLLILAGLFLAGVAVLQWLWNITLPGIFNVRQVTYWEAFRLLLITTILFRS